jgi:hypothetical protein
MLSSHSFVDFEYKDCAILPLTHIFSNILFAHNTVATPTHHHHNTDHSIAVCESDNQNILLLSILSPAWINHFSNALPPAIFLLSHFISASTVSPSFSISDCNHNLIFSADDNILFFVGSYFR